MKKYSFLLLILGLLVASCEQPASDEGDASGIGVSPDSVETVDTDETIVEDPVYAAFSDKENEFDKEARELREATLAKLESAGEKDDKIVMSFIEDYGKIVENAGNAGGGIIDEDGQSHYKESPYFDVDFAEGDAYVSSNPDYIQSLSRKASKLSQKFLSAYAEESRNDCCDDAALVIPVKEQFNRVLSWGSLSEKSAGTEFEEMSTSRYKSYLSFICSGLDNTPVFDYDTKKYNEEYRASMDAFIKSNPEAKATAEFKKFVELLDAGNSMMTPEIEAFQMAIWK